MKILVTAATPSELSSIKSWIKSAKLKANLDIDFLCCGIWNYETISSLESYLIEKTEPVFIRNIWICGYWNPNNEKKSEVIQVATTMNIHTEKEFIIPPFIQVAPLRNCFSSENIVFKKPEFKKKIWVINNEYYFDMESRWIEFIASKYKYPCLILKVPFDFIWDETKEFLDNGDKFRGKENIANLLNNLSYSDFLHKILEWVNKQGNI